VDLTFDLMADLGASDEQLDFPILYAVAREGRAFKDMDAPRDDMEELFETVLEEIPAPGTDLGRPFQMLVTNLDYSDYLGRIVIGRVQRGEVRKGEFVNLVHKNGTMTKTRVVQPFTHLGLQRIEADTVGAGDIVALSGIEDAQIGETVADLADPEALPIITVDEPTVSMTFGPNTSPFAGKEGRYVTSRHLRDRLMREVQTNVSLRVEELSPEEFEVSGRGELHLSILLETMRREGYEVQVGSPRVIVREIEGKKHEPFEHLVLDVPERFSSTIIGTLSGRKGQLVDVEPQGSRTRIEFKIPARALFGFRTQFLSMTQGEGIMSHVFDGYAPWAGDLKTRTNGSMVRSEGRHRLRLLHLEAPGARRLLYPARHRRLRRHGRRLLQPRERPQRQRLQEQEAHQRPLRRRRRRPQPTRRPQDDPRDALEYIGEDELVEITPESIRLRKKDPRTRHAQAVGLARRTGSPSGWALWPPVGVLVADDPVMVRVVSAGPLVLNRQSAWQRPWSAPHGRVYRRSQSHPGRGPARHGGGLAAGEAGARAGVRGVGLRHPRGGEKGSGLPRLGGAPPSDSDDDEYRIVFRFDHASNLHAWENSEERRRWLRKSRPMLHEEEKVHVLTGLETWFTLPSKAGEPAPPRYKMAAVTWLAVFPVVMVIFSIFGQWLNLLPTLLRTLVFTLVMVTLMTYVIMPRMTRLFSFWLYPDRD
jgi:GTP-binding protein